MPSYVAENEAIEGKRIYCTFEKRPSCGLEKERQHIAITGNPATATLMEVWKYKQS